MGGDRAGKRTFRHETTPASHTRGVRRRGPEQQPGGRRTAGLQGQPLLARAPAPALERCRTCVCRQRLEPARLPAVAALLTLLRVGPGRRGGSQREARLHAHRHPLQAASCNQAPPCCTGLRPPPPCAPPAASLLSCTWPQQSLQGGGDVVVVVGHAGHAQYSGGGPAGVGRQATTRVSHPSPPSPASLTASTPLCRFHQHRPKATRGAPT